VSENDTVTSQAQTTQSREAAPEEMCLKATAVRLRGCDVLR